MSEHQYHPKHISFYSSPSSFVTYTAHPHGGGATFRALHISGYGLLLQFTKGAEIIFSLLAISLSYTYVRLIQQFCLSMMELRRNPYRKCKIEEALEVSIINQQDRKRRRSCTVEIPPMRPPTKIQRTLQYVCALAIKLQGAYNCGQQGYTNFIFTTNPKWTISFCEPPKRD